MQTGRPVRASQRRSCNRFRQPAVERHYSAVSFRANPTVEQSLSVGPLRAAFAACWERMVGAPVPIRQLRSVMDPPIPVKTVLAFSKLQFASSAAEMDQFISELIEHLQAQLRELHASSQLTLFEPANEQTPQCEARSPGGGKVSSLNQLLERGRKFLTIYGIKGNDDFFRRVTPMITNNSNDAAVPNAEPRLIRYARVSTDDQDLSLQIDALQKHGIPKSRIFMDKLSGAKTERPGLTKCLNTLQDGDILVVWRLDRLGRSMRHLITVVEDLRERGIGFRSLSEGAIDTTTASGELIFNIFSALAQFERRLIQERTKAGLAAARARGRNGGRPKVFPNEAKVLLAKKLYLDKSMSVDDICETLKISRSTYYRYVRM